MNECKIVHTGGAHKDGQLTPLWLFGFTTMPVLANDGSTKQKHNDVIAEDAFRKFWMPFRL